MNKAYIYLNIIALFFYGLQYYLDWTWLWLSERQDSEGFKQVTGLFLLIFLLFQNALILSRVHPLWKKYQKGFYQLHTQSSIFSIPLLYLHAVKFGYNYTLLLNLSYTMNVLIGSLAPKPLNIHNKRYGYVWMVSHVALAVFTSFFLFFHIFTTFYYN